MRSPLDLSVFKDRRLILLSIMMFLEFFIWGCWFITTNNFLGENPGLNRVRPWIYSVIPIAAVISPLFLGIVADRFFASERVLGVMTLLAGAAMLGVALVAGKDGGSGDLRWLYFAFFLLHGLCYAPTLGLTNTVAFHNLTDQEKQFPIVRVFGTFGWIVASGWIVSKLLHADKSVMQYYLCSGACLALGIFSFFLPHTPPPAKGQKASARAILGVDALSLMKNPSFAIFIIGSFLICIPLAAYFEYGSSFVEAAWFKDPGFVMSFGQVVEVVFMIAMPVFFAFLGVKWMLMLGMLAWVVRYALFSAAAPAAIAWMIVIGILLHGICYDFFFVTGFIYTDKRVGKQMRGQAQGLLVLVTQGLGMLMGVHLAHWLDKRILTGKGRDLLAQYQQFWLVPCIMAAVVMIAFILFFKDDGKTARAEEAKEAEALAR